MRDRLWYYFQYLLVPLLFVGYILMYGKNAVKIAWASTRYEIICHKRNYRAARALKL